MKETEGSLRGVFYLAGIVVVLVSLLRLSYSSVSMLPAKQQVAFYVPVITWLVLGVCFYTAGLQLKTALPTGARWIKKLLVASGALLLAAELGLDAEPVGMVATFIGLAITIYLHRNVTRLAAETVARTGAPLATAKLV